MVSPREATTASPATESSAPPWKSACVVLRPAGASAGPRVEGWLADRGLKAIALHDAASAFAAMCLGERCQASRAEWGLPRVDSMMLLIEQPDAWRDLEPMVAAVAHYAPDSGIATIDREEVRIVRRPRIEPRVMDLAAKPARPQPEFPTAARPAPVLRIAGDDDDEPAAIAPPAAAGPKLTLTSVPTESAPAPDSEEDDAETQAEEVIRVTQDELSMLLDDESDRREGRR